MTPRDTLDGVILDLEINDHPNAGNGRAALRELDQLLQDFWEARHHNAYDGHWKKLMERAAQAGYGEK